MTTRFLTQSRRAGQFGISQDLQELHPIRRRMLDYGMTLELPLFTGAPAEIREPRRLALRRCDDVLIYWGRAGVNASLVDASRARTAKRSSSFRIAVCAAAPPTPEKLRFDYPNVPTIQAKESLDKGLDELIRVFAEGSSQ